MTTTGYSDRINHALAFAAKHHDQQVRKGVRLPYVTHSANVALILTRYGQDESTVVAGILHDMVEECVSARETRESLERRVGEKFGLDALNVALAATPRMKDDDDDEMSSDERREDYLARLGSADERARWVCAADKLHNGSTILADLKRTQFPETVWSRMSGGRDATLAWYRGVYDRLVEVGFTAPIMDELKRMIEALEKQA